ncbi:MAG: CCA tRNA nucleotidyltransferase [Euryarchaeota archaeon]|nr:CCA tRNA nucleotidyltransferase [Euryarchaeota archaeon]
MQSEIRTILATVLDRIKPTPVERDELAKLARRIAGYVEEEGVPCELVGSAARNTWISGEHDLDIFIMFPTTLNREELEDEGLRIAKSVAERSDSYEIRYAEHPYVHGRFEGYRVDLVPCYRLSSASELKSAVDRTPFHNKYILSKIGGLEDDVLLLKQFMKCANVYGSELRVCGFSGLLCELLILHYGSFRGVLDAACDWRDGLLIEPGGGGTSQRSPDTGSGHGGVWEALCVIDPTDPHRNVAAALSLDQFYVFVDAARGFLAAPSIEYFFAEPVPHIDKPEIVAAMDARGTDLLAIVFEIPDMVEDIVYPQLYRMQESVLALLSEHEFAVHGSAATVLPASETTDTVVMLIELVSGKLPPLRKHAGPPAYMRKHAERFKMKLVGEDTFSNVYIEDGRYVVDLCRTYRSAKDLLMSELHSRALGKQLRKEAREGYAVLEGIEVVDAVDLAFLSRYFKK